MSQIGAQTWLLTLFQIIIFYQIFVSTTAANDNAVTTTVTATTTVSKGGDLLKLDFGICDSLPKRRQKACKMVLQMGAAARKAEQKGEFTEDELPPPSVKLNVPFVQKTTKKIEAGKSELPPRVIAELYACLNLTCLCNYFEGESSAPDQCLISQNSNSNKRQKRKRNQRYFGKALRMEYRMLSDQQRLQFHNALLKLKHGRDSYEYDRISFLHSNPRMMLSAHSGPTFLLWHREYLKRFEIALRAIDPSVAVPYWDSSMDQRLDDPADSIMWTNLFLGSSDDDGYVVDGFLANWITSNGDRVKRNLGIDGELLAEDEIINIITNRRYENVFGFPSRKAKNTECTLPMTKAQDLLEFNHNNVHTWIGGDMEKLPTSPQDPIFFMHHAFVDFIWEQWRQNWQSREERETQFPPEAQIVPCSGSRNYLLNATMLPFYDPVVLNRVGLSNDYTDFLYAFAPRPTCKSAGGCGSLYLFCDTTTNGTAFCCAKIKRGGNCAKFQKNSEEPCYDSFCINGKCQAANYGEKHFLNVVLFNELSSSSIGTSTLPGYVADGTDHHINFTTSKPSSPTPFSSVDETAQTTASFQLSSTTSAQQILLYDETSSVANTVDNTVELLTNTSPTSSLPNERECFDNHECCAHWAANGSCCAAPRFMNTWCPASCRYDGCRPHATEGQGIQKDVLSQCKRWAHSHEKKGHGEGWHAFKPGCVLAKPTTRSECQRNRHWMARNCPEACGCEFVRELLDKCSKNMPEDYKLEPIDE